MKNFLMMTLILTLTALDNANASKLEDCVKSLKSDFDTFVKQVKAKHPTMKRPELMLEVPLFGMGKRRAGGRFPYKDGKLHRHFESACSSSREYNLDHLLEKARQEKLSIIDGINDNSSCSAITTLSQENGKTFINIEIDAMARVSDPFLGEVKRVRETFRLDTSKLVLHGADSLTLNTIKLFDVQGAEAVIDSHLYWRTGVEYHFGPFSHLLHPDKRSTKVFKATLIEDNQYLHIVCTPKSRDE